MTSIICWKNEEESESLWAVSDSRVTGNNGRMTDNCPKLFKMEVKARSAEHLPHHEPELLFTFGFGFAGSTLVGMNVKEMLSQYLSSLTSLPTHNGQAPRKPSLQDVANVAKSIAEKYISFLAVCYQDNLGFEFTVFGFCHQSNQYKVFHARNEISRPLELQLNAVGVSNGQFLIIGDRKGEITDMISEFRETVAERTLNWWRAPFVCLASIVRDDSMETIGGYLQFVISSRLGANTYFIASDNEANMVGFDLFSQNIPLGDFFVMPQIGMSMPSPTGW
ncbi:hypothetical protein SL034_005535 [Vibrio harveyi]|nr:hypothetical protein [Vibrio harveyi]